MNKLLATGLRLLAVCFWCLTPASLHAQQLRLEYFFDSDPGFGLGQWMTVTTGAALRTHHLAGGVRSSERDTHHQLRRILLGH